MEDTLNDERHKRRTKESGRVWVIGRMEGEKEGWGDSPASV